MAKIETEKKVEEKGLKRKANADGNGPTPPKIPDTDLYAKITTREETLAKERDADEDAALYIETCKEISKLLVTIADIKINKPDGAAALLKEIQGTVNGKIMSLKRLNRLEKMRMKESREVLQKYREQVDSDNLHLQNLVYENLHLSKEVSKCYDFKSIDEDMNLIPVEEFYALAPVNVTNEEKTRNNPHELKLARLSWELTQRKELAAKLKQLQVTKETIAKDIEAKKEQLGNILPNLKAAIEATKPLQNMLDIPVDKNKKLRELALLLPKPLYILFVQAHAFSSLTKWLKVTILGKPDEVQVQDHHYDTISSDSDSDNDNGESLRRRKQTQERRKSGVKGETERAEALKEEILKKSTLSVKLTISLPGGVSISLVFQWLTTLEFVCVLGSVSGAESSGIVAADLLTSTNILSSMISGDLGDTCPNPMAFYHLKRAGLSALPADVPGLGIPYNWAQTLCGLNFFDSNVTPSLPSVSVCQQSLENILCIIKNRVRNRIKLAKEITLLESGEALRDKKLQAYVASFSAVTLNDFQSTASGMRFVNDSVVDGSNLFYQATIDVAGLKVTASIALPASYPQESPVFAIEVIHKNKTMDSLGSDHIRDVEREVNVCGLDEDGLGEQGREKKRGLLMTLMHRLLLCIQVLVATEFSSDSAVKATCFRAASGRKRSHPYRYLDSADGIYTHR